MLILLYLVLSFAADFDHNTLFSVLFLDVSISRTLFFVHISGLATFDKLLKDVLITGLAIVPSEENLVSITGLATVLSCHRQLFIVPLLQFFAALFPEYFSELEVEPVAKLFSSLIVL